MYLTILAAGKKVDRKQQRIKFGTPGLPGSANARGSQGGGMVGYNHRQPPTQARPVKLESPTGADSPHLPPPSGSAGQGRNNVNDFGQGQQGAGGGGGNGGQQPILNTSELIISGMSLTNLDVNTGERCLLSSEVILTTHQPMMKAL